MANRHLARSAVLQVIFERDASAGRMTADEALGRLAEYAQEFGTNDGDNAFMRSLLQLIITKQKEVDEVIVKAAPEWPLEKIAAIDRAILRLGLTELLFADRAQVPAKVAINESIELAKAYGGASSSKFVNGVMGSVYVELGEPGKADGATRKKEIVSPGRMVVEELVGAVVYAREGDDIYLALVHDIFGHWTLSKGKLQEEETREDGVVRKIREELGLDVQVEMQIGENGYIANDPSADWRQEASPCDLLPRAIRIQRLGLRSKMVVSMTHSGFDLRQ